MGQGDRIQDMPRLGGGRDTEILGYAAHTK
jgi:hypothetical protein